MVGIAHDHPRDTVNVQIVKTGEIMHDQNVSWYPETTPGGQFRLRRRGIVIQLSQLV